MAAEWKPTICYQCKAECPILVRVDNGTITGIRGNPAGGQHGKCCVKSRSGQLMQYSPDRLLYPLKRVGDRGAGTFARIAWKEALDTIADKLKDLQDRGEQHKLTASFFPHSITDPKWRFLDAYGGFINTALPHCDSAKIIAFAKSVGGVPIHHIPPAYFTVPQGGVIVSMGRNTLGCLDGVAQCKDILDAKARGAKLIVINPYFNEDAAKADQWIPIKPGTDNAFLLGAIHKIIKEGWYDHDFVNNWVRKWDFARLTAYIADKTPQSMSEICGVSPGVIENFARDCAQAGGAVGIDGFKGQMLGQALDVCHAWVILTAITGAMDAPGGQPLPEVTSLSPVEPVPPFANLVNLHEKGWHRTGPDHDAFERYSFIMEPTWYEAKAIQNGDLKVLIVGEANPALTEMGQANWQQAVTERDLTGNYKLELLVSFEIMLSETSKFADIVLPDKTYFERWEMMYMPWWYSFGPAVFLRQPVVEAPGECRHANEWFIELGKRLVHEYFKFKNDVEYYDIQLAGLGLSVDQLVQMGGIWSSGPIKFYKYRDSGGFPTSSGKCHLYWEDLEGPPSNQALPRPDPAPEYMANAEDYPFILLSIRRISSAGSGQWTFNNPSLRDKMSGMYDNPVLMHPDAARDLHIKDGDEITLQSPPPWGGQVQVTVQLTEGIRPDCIAMWHGYGSSVGRVASLCGVSDNRLIQEAGYTLGWQDLIGGEAHVSTRVRILT